MWKAYLETTNFSFEAYGSSLSKASAAMKNLLEEHARQYQLEFQTFYNKFIGDVQTMKITPGAGYRDGEQIIPWDKFTRVYNYRKTFYDVKLSDGKILKHFWPNAGKMAATDGSGLILGPDDNIRVRETVTRPHK